MKFQAFHVNPGEKLKKKMSITILAILCQSFLVGVNTKNPSKSADLFKKTPKNWTIHITWGSIQEWGSINADTVYWSNFWKVLLYKKGGGEFQILGLILLKYVQRQGETRDSNYILTTGRTHTYDVGKFSTVLPPKKKINWFFKNSGQNQPI